MWNLPNILTLMRVALLPVIVALIWPGIESPVTCFWAAVLFVLAGITDVVDGKLARERNQVTVAGKFLDPLADKLFLLVTMMALVQLPGPRLPVWLVMAYLARELAITGLRGVAIAEGIVIGADRWGKHKTATGIVGMAFLLGHYTYSIDFVVVTATVNLHRVGFALMLLSVTLAYLSGIRYLANFVRELKKAEAQRA